MRRDLEDYRAATTPAAAAPIPDVDTRAQFLGGNQDAALTWRVIGSLSVCVVLVGTALLLIG